MSNKNVIESRDPLNSDNVVSKTISRKISVRNEIPEENEKCVENEKSGENEKCGEKTPFFKSEKTRRINPMKTQVSQMARAGDFLKGPAVNTFGIERLARVMATHISPRQVKLAQDLICEHEAGSYLLRKKMPASNFMSSSLTRKITDSPAARKRSLPGVQNQSLNPDQTLGLNSIDNDSWNGKTSSRGKKSNIDASYGTSHLKENLIINPMITVTPFREKGADIPPPDSKQSPPKKLKSKGKSSDNKKEGSSSYRGWVSAAMLRLNGAKLNKKLGIASSKESVNQTYGKSQTHSDMKKYCSSVLRIAGDRHNVLGNKHRKA